MERSLILYLHILSASLLVGGAVAARVARQSVLGAPDLASLRGAADVVRRVSLAHPGFAMVMLASGLYLGRVGFWREAWFWAAVAAWILNSALAARVLAPSGRRLGMAIARAGDGPIPVQVEALRSARAPAIAADVMLGLDLAVLLLMIAMPTAAMTIFWLLLGVALMLAVGLAEVALTARRRGACVAA